MLKPSFFFQIFVAVVCTTVTRADQPRPEWVHCAVKSMFTEADPPSTARSGEGYLRKTFSIDQAVTAATLRACGDGTFVELFLGGRRVAELEPFDPVLLVDVTQLCSEGPLAIAMRLGTSPPIRCAAFVQLELKFADGSRRMIVTDDSWLCRTAAPADWTRNEFDDSNWGPPALLGAVDDWLLVPSERSMDIDAAENYDQWKQAIGASGGTDPATFQLTAGFEIELLRSAREDEDSWVSMTVDPQGRVIVGKEQVGLLRMTLNEAGTVDQVETINDSMKECRGLLFVGDDLFVNANNSKGLYRLPADGDRFGVPELIYESGGGVGHGRNELTLGADGKIYSIHGDSVDLPSGCRDFTSPFRDARRGIKTSEGHLLRIDPETREVEVLASGLRNPFGIDFNTRGDCFTYDADAEYDMGAPWYRPTRVSHLTLGSDYGWRGVTKQWPPYYPDHPDNARPGVDIGKGSPTAVKFGTRSHFPKRYREALFILDWTYGRIIAVHTIPRGSSYVMTAETFLQGRPLNVTDLDFGIDGSMYLVTGGRGTQSALYRIRYTGGEATAAPPTRQQIYRQRIATAMHDARRRLESRLADDAAGVGTALASDDPWIRGAARHLLERQDATEWRDLAFSHSNDKMALSLLLSLARSGDDAAVREKIAERLCELEWPAMSRTWRETAVYTLSLCIANWQPGDELTARLVSKLGSNYPDREFSINQVASEILVRLTSKSVVGRSLALAAGTTRQAEQMHYLFILRNAQPGWTPEHRRTYFQLLAGTADYLGGQGMNDFLTRIRADAVETLSAEQREQLADVIQASDSNSAHSLADAVRRPIVAEWTLEKLTAALSKLNGPGDPARGRQLFAEASCVHCHRVGGYGRLIGPDLTNVSRRFSQRDLLTSMLEPSKMIPEKYQSVQVVTTDGRVFSGMTALGGDYRSTKLRLAANALDPYDITEIEKDEIDQLRPLPISWMPNGLVNTLDAEEIADLLAYLNAGR